MTHHGLSGGGGGGGGVELTLIDYCGSNKSII